MKARHPFFFALVFLFPLAACGDERRVATDSGTDSAASDAAPDAVVDGGPATCPEDVVTFRTFDMVPDGPDGQIHPAVVWDGSRIVLVYNEPDPSRGFDVFVNTLSCDGVAGEAVRVSTTDHNEVDPDINYDGSSYLVAWTSDDGAPDVNLHAFARGLDASLTPAGDSDVEVVTQMDGAPVVGNHFVHGVGVDAAGFVIVGVRGVAEIDRFQAYAQGVDGMAALLGDAFAPALEPMVTHQAASYVSTGRGAALLFDRSEDDRDSQVVVVDAAGGFPEPVVSGLVQSAGSSASSGDGAVFAAIGGQAMGGSVGVHLTDISQPSGMRPSALLGDLRTEFGPKIATGPGGGAVAFYRSVSGFSNALIVQRFDYTGGAFSLGPEIQVVGERAAPYQPAFVHVRDDIYFVAWAEGTTPDFRIKGRYVDLAD